MEPVTAPPTDQLTTRSHRRAIAGAFAVQGLLFISLTLRLPQLKALFELSELELAALMLLLVVLAGVGSVAAELLAQPERVFSRRELARRRDSALALRVALGLVAVGVVVIGQAARGDGSLPLLVAGMAVYGLGLGANDASANMQAIAVEHHLGRWVDRHRRITPGREHQRTRHQQRGDQQRAGQDGHAGRATADHEHLPVGERR